MERILIKHKHPKNTILLLASRVLERASFYGFRAILIFYMTSQVLKLENKEALQIYGWFTGAMLISHIIGAIISDLKIGNKTGLIAGGILQAIGALILCYQTLNGLYLGLVLFLIGEGFYTPNIRAQFGKLYLNKPKLLDAAFTLFYLAVNLGAFIGPLLIGFVGEEFDFTFGFVIVAVLSLGSVVIVLLLKSHESGENFKFNFSIKYRVLIITSVFLLGGIFWGIYEIIGNHIYNIQDSFIGFKELDLPPLTLNFISTSFTIPLSLATIIIWSYFYYNPIIKLFLGYVLAAISYAVLLFLSESPEYTNLAVFTISIFIFSIAELHIVPIGLSIATKYTNPKYLASTISLSLLPIKGFAYLSGLYLINRFEDPFLSFSVGAIIMGVIGVGMIIGIVTLYKKGIIGYNN